MLIGVSMPHVGMSLAERFGQERRGHRESGKGEDDDGLDGNHFDCVGVRKMRRVNVDGSRCKCECKYE